MDRKVCEMMEPAIEEILKEFSHLPRFEDGRINYSSSHKAPVLICFVKHGGDILFLKRSEKVYAYRGLWSTVAGFIDSNKKISDKVMEELEEELDIRTNNISSMHFGEHYLFHDPPKTWIRYPILVTVKEKPVITLDWEHIEYRWVKPNEITHYKTPPGTEECLERVL